MGKLSVISSKRDLRQLPLFECDECDDNSDSALKALYLALAEYRLLYFSCRPFFYGLSSLKISLKLYLIVEVCVIFLRA